MKKAGIAIALALVSLTLSAAEKEVKTKAKEVTIFKNGAQVQRQQTVALEKGETTLRFTGLSPYLKANSVQVNAKGNLTILSVKGDKNYISEAQKNKNTEALTKQKEEIDRQIANLNVKNKVADEEREFISKNRRVTGTDAMVNMAILKQANDYYRERLTALLTEKNANDAEIERLKKQKKQIEQQIADEGQTSDQATGEIEVKVVSNSAQNAVFDLSYYVGNASWTPIYDIRVKNVQEPVALDIKAEVSQNTKEEWNDVKLTLSSANPTQGGTAPVLTKWELRDRNEIRVRGANVYHAPVEPMLMTSAKRSIVATVEGDPLADVAVGPEVTIQEQTTAVEYAIETKYSLPSGEKNTTVTIGQQSLAATYEYVAIPKLENDVFLTARVADWEKLQLQSGKANLFFQNTYVGQTYINAKATTDTLSLSLGRDKSVAVSRVQEEKMTGKKTLSDKVTVTRGWKVTVKNNKSVAIDLTLKDQLPKSTYSDVVVTEENTDGASVNKSTGEVAWKLYLNAGESISKSFSYKVKYPSSRNIDVQ